MSKVQSIKCSNCGAPLKLLGGGRVMTVTCAYCKSVLDLNDNYKVLSNFRNTKELNALRLLLWV
jgi:LSD1 subclass zinc finger protein